MLKLIEGGFFSGAREQLYELIKARVENEKSCFLLVPEQQTVLSESQLASILPSSAPRFFEVTNFTRFADTMFRTFGGLSGEYAEAGQKALVMWRTLTELEPYAESHFPKEIGAGVVKKYLGAVSQMKKLSLSPAELEEGAKQLEAGGERSFARLKEKLSDLSAVMTLYKQLLEEHFSDSEDVLEKLAESLAKEKNVLSDTEIYIEGFTSFTEPQYKVISALMRICPITIVLGLARAGGEAPEFAEISDTKSKLLLCASRANIDVSSERLADTEIQHAPLLREVCGLLWRTGLYADGDILNNTDALKIFEAKTPYDECDFVAQDIKRRVIEGARYSDFGIIARDLTAYSGIIESSFERAGIPLFLSKRPEVDTYEIIKLIYSALGAVTGGYSRKDVISYAKCSLCGVSRDECDELEIYCDLWQIDGDRFTEDSVWHMNPDGLTDKRSAEAEEKLLRIDRTRRALIEPLAELEEALRDGTVTSHASGLWKFLCRLNVEVSLMQRAEALMAQGHADEAQDTKRLWKILCSSLDGICKIMKDATVPPETFLTLIKVCLEEADIGRIPSFVDRVSVSSADMARLHEKRHLYIIGANYGSFPGAISEDGYFTENDRAALEAMGLPITPENEIKSARELYYVCRSISFAKESVYILYHSKDGGYKDCAPSEIIKRISDITAGKITPRRISDIPLIEKAYHKDYALENIGSFGEYLPAAKAALRLAGEEERLKISELDVKNNSLNLTKATAEKLYGGSLALTQSRIDSFVGCPLRYFCNYTLKLNPTGRAEFNAANIGTFIHEVLEKFFDTLKKKGTDIASITDEEKDSLIMAAAKGFAERYFEGIPKRSERLKTTIDRLCRSARPVVDGLCDEFANCKFAPKFFELAIDKNKPGNPEPAIFKASDGRDVYIYGVIDRVDTYENDGDVYVRVVDYKTGSKEFSPSDLERGENLQMFLYLKSIVDTDKPEFRESLGLADGRKAIPSGVIYVKTDVGDGKITSPDGKGREKVLEKQKRLGMILDDPISIGAMNKNYLPIKVDKKSGELLTEGSKLVYSSEGWEAINEKIANAIKDIADRMISGEIAATKDCGKGAEACRYCDFKAFCRSSS